MSVRPLLVKPFLSVIVCLFLPAIRNLALPFLKHSR